MALRDHLRILVVDDMSTSRGLIIQALDQLGLRNVTTADSSQMALEMLAKSPAHLIISDFHMPKTSGLELLQYLRSKERTKGVGFILITGRAEPEIIEQGKQLGMNNYLKKPFQPQEMRQCIEAVVGRL